MRLPSLAPLAAAATFALALAACQPSAPATEAASPDLDARAQDAAVTLPATLVGADAPTMTVYKSPTCGCCAMWVEHIEAAGFTVETRDRDDMAAVKDSLGLPSDLSSCHTGVVDGYVVEGHVPAEHVARLLEERPAERWAWPCPGCPSARPAWRWATAATPTTSWSWTRAVRPPCSPASPDRRPRSPAVDWRWPPGGQDGLAA